MTLEPATVSADRAEASSRRRHGLVALALATLAFLVFVRSVAFGFLNFDDYDYVARHSRVLQGLSWENVRWAFTTLKLLNWHPLTWLSYLADATLYGAWAGGFHLTNTLIHAAVCGLLYLVLADLTRRPWPSAAVVALFAVHPLRAESVVWIAERKDVLSALLFVATIGAYGRSARADRPARRRLWYVVALLAYALGLMSKAMLVTTPCVMLLLDFWPLARVCRVRVMQLLIEKLPFVPMAVSISAVTYYAQHHGGAVGEERTYPLSIRLGNSVWAYGRYLRKTVWPNDLAIFYPYTGLGDGSIFPWWRVIVSGLVLLGITLAAVMIWQRRGGNGRAVLVGWLWFLGMLVPTIGIVQVGAQALADRYTYLPHIGLFIAIVFGVDELIGDRARLRRIAPRVAVAAVAAFAVTTSWQLGRWRNGETIFRQAIAVTQRNARAHACLALVYTDQGRHADAAEQYRIALHFQPDNPEANNNYGNMLLAAGHTDEALARYERAVRAQPRYAEAHNNLANFLARRQEFERAIRHHELAVRFDPDLPQAQYNFGVTLAAVGRLSESQARLERALQLKPDYADARYTYGLVMASLGYEAAAVAQLREANFLRADWFDALRSLTWLLATSPDMRVRDGAQAVVVGERLNQLSSFEEPVALDTLATAYAETGRWESAVATAARAEQLARTRGQSDLADSFARRLELYRHNRPFHRVAGSTTQPFNP